MAKKKSPGFGEYKIAFGKYYRKGNTYKKGMIVVMPLDEKPPSPELCNTDGSEIEWDAKLKLVVNAHGVAKPKQSGDEQLQLARGLANKLTVGQLQEQCYGLDLDPNGTKLDMAGKILAAQMGAIAKDDDDDSDDSTTTDVGGAAED